MYFCDFYFCFPFTDTHFFPPPVRHCRRTIVSDASSLYDNTQFTPDAVLLNLGTNDFGHDSGPAWEAAFTAAYAQFLVDLTAAHKNPALVCMHVFFAIRPFDGFFDAKHNLSWIH
jgi:hypothetical protein